MDKNQYQLTKHDRKGKQVSASIFTCGDCLKELFMFTGKDGMGLDGLRALGEGWILSKEIWYCPACAQFHNKPSYANG